MDSSPSVNSQNKTWQRLVILFAKSERHAAILQALNLLSLCYPQRVELSREQQLKYLENLEDLNPEQLATAFTRAEQETDFFPAVGTLRKLAGCPTAAQLSEQAAREALQWLIDLVRRHGCDLRPVEGPMIRPPYRDDTGKPQPGTYEADIPAPQIPERSILALEKITMGRWKNESDRKGAMQWVLSHPALARNAEAYDNVTLREAAIVKYEARWLRAWAETEPRSVALEVVA